MQRLTKLLRSRNPADLKEANDLIKNIVDEVIFNIVFNGIIIYFDVYN